MSRNDFIQVDNKISNISNHSKWFQKVTKCNKTEQKSNKLSQKYAHKKIYLLELLMRIIENKYIERYLSNQKMPYKGTIANWSFDIINSNKAIIGDIYQCFGYSDGKTISTSPIRSVSIESVRAKDDKFVVVNTTSGSKYILLRPDTIFTNFINNCFEIT